MATIRNSNRKKEAAKRGDETQTKEEISGNECRKSKGGPFANVPERLIEKLVLNVKVFAEKKLNVRVTTECQVYKLPTDTNVEMATDQQLDLGDLIKEVNGVEVTSKNQLYQLLQKAVPSTKTDYKLVLVCQRLIRTEPIGNNFHLIPAAVDLQLGFTYLLGYMALLPRGSLGLKIKTYNFKIYVTSTDNGFNCISKRTLLVGDAILAVDEKPVANLKECSQMLTVALEKKGYVSMVIERPDNALVAPLVRAALIAEKTIEADPRMADDVADLCKEELARMAKRDPKEPLKPLIRVNKTDPTKKTIDVEKTKKTIDHEKVRKTIGFKDTTTEINMGMDPINPILLRQVPGHGGTQGQEPPSTSGPSNREKSEEPSQIGRKRITPKTSRVKI